MSGKDGFGPGLRAHRERRGLTLESIAKTTKIKASLLASLERNDVSQWPAGIFRRAFLRSYANAVGLPSEPLVSDFQRYFPEEGVPDPTMWIEEEPLPSPRLTLADIGERRGTAKAHAWGAGLELLAVLLLAALGAGLTSFSFWTMSGAMALLYYPLATGLSGRTIPLTALRRPSWVAWPTPSADAEPEFYADDPELPLRDPSAETDSAASPDEFRPGHTAIH